MRWVFAVGLLVGCYRPNADPPCITRCDPQLAGEVGACPGALVCASDGMCHRADGSCGPTLMDGDVIDNGPNPDDSTSFCYGQGLLRICLQAPPSGSRELETSIDTGVVGNCTELVPQVGGPPLCVVAAERVDLSDVSIRGSRPLVVIASDTVTITGSVDVASRRIEGAGNRAAGSNETTCASTQNPLAGSGGNGGSFGGRGGRGGNAPSLAAEPVDPMVLRGGCPGVDGRGNNPPVGGRGGGAIYFIAGLTIVANTATINASGAGGGAQTGASGGGGGSGGMVGFDAPSIITVGSQVFANGGGGGGGSDDANAAGAGGEPTSFDDMGSGGFGTNATGGNGSQATINGEYGLGLAINGGGGGGGGGVIVIYPVTQSSAFNGATSPPITQ